MDEIEALDINYPKDFRDAEYFIEKGIVKL
jgi:hypothetical protein